MVSRRREHGKPRNTGGEIEHLARQPQAGAKHEAAEQYVEEVREWTECARDAEGHVIDACGDHPRPPAELTDPAAPPQAEQGRTTAGDASEAPSTTWVTFGV